MRTILWATLTANGSYAHATEEHPPRPEALADFAAWAGLAGNFVVGRRTFEGFQTEPSRKVDDADQVFARTDIVVVSSRTLDVPGVTFVPSPEAALEQLEARGHATALLSGGETLHNAFLARGLVDELVFVIVPALDEGGLRLRLPEGGYQDVRLLESKDLGNGITQLRYAIGRAARGASASRSSTR